MAGIRLFNVHYVWEDCVSMGLGALIVLTSWMGDDAVSQTAAANATIVGILVLALGASEVVNLRRWRRALKPRADCGSSRRHSFLATPMLARSDTGTLSLASLSCC